MIKQSLCFIFSILVFCYVSYVIGELMLFLSNPRSVQIKYDWILNLSINHSHLESSFLALILDAIYLIIFMLQHSLMKSKLVQIIYMKLKLQLLDRTVYSLTTSLSLHYLIKNWLSVPTLVLWQIDLSESSSLWWSYIFLHVFAWVIVYGGSLIMDLPEIIGTKQVYYNIKEYAKPLNYKSFELRHLYGHVRHPSFTGFLLILWCTNLMTIDRFFLSVMLTFYMYIAWSTDHNDIIYHKCQLQRKKEEFSVNNF